MLKLNVGGHHVKIKLLALPSIPPEAHLELQVALTEETQEQSSEGGRGGGQKIY
jgi:hypothetical protein